MNTIDILKKSNINGVITVPGDKSISHRGVMLGAISKGQTRLSGFLDGADCAATIDCFKQMGIKIEKEAENVIIHGKGLNGLCAPNGTLDVKNSGTTLRLLSGILSAMPFSSVISGDASIQKRPMKRIIDPLTKMGAGIHSENDNNCAPLIIDGGKELNGITWNSPVASAQVKSCILFAGLYANGDTTVVEPSLSRDHSERMLKALGADITTDGNTVTLHPGNMLNASDIHIPGDISSAAYFIAAGLLVPHGQLTIQNVNINPTRAGIITVLKEMGANLTIENKRLVSGEETADITVSHSNLHGTVISGDIIPALIDELPVIAVLSAFAEGTTTIRDASELKVKESDRISLITDNLTNMGADVTPCDDGMIIHGGKPLRGGLIRTASDHRIAMSFAIAALGAEGVTTLDNSDCVNISFPGFFEQINSITS